MTGMVLLLCSATNTISHLRSVHLHLLHHYNQITHLFPLVENTSEHMPVSKCHATMLKHYYRQCLMSAAQTVCLVLRQQCFHTSAVCSLSLPGLEGHLQVSFFGHVAWVQLVARDYLQQDKTQWSTSVSNVYIFPSIINYLGDISAHARDSHYH